MLVEIQIKNLETLTQLLACQRLQYMDALTQHKNQKEVNLLAFRVQETQKKLNALKRDILN